MKDSLPPRASGFSDADRLRLALDAARLGDWSWDAASDIMTLSPRAAEIFGVRPGPIMTWTAIRGLLHPDDRERVQQEVEAAINDRSHYDTQYRIQTGAADAWVAARGHGTYAEDGTVIGMLGIVQDITAQMCAQATLLEQSQALQTLNDVGRMLSAELDLKKLVQALTDAATRIVRAQFGAFFYNILDAGNASYT